MLRCERKKDYFNPRRKIMDRNFYQQKLAQEHQREISQELATQHLLNEAGARPLASKRVKRIILRIAPAMVVIVTLLWLHFLG
jgi:hypothetical protein